MRIRVTLSGHRLKDESRLLCEGRRRRAIRFFRRVVEPDTEHEPTLILAFQEPMHGEHARLRPALECGIRPELLVELHAGLSANIE